MRLLGYLHGKKVWLESSLSQSVGWGGFREGVCPSRETGCGGKTPRGGQSKYVSCRVRREHSQFMAIYIYIYIYTGCPRRNVPNFGRVFLMLNYTDITQNTYIQS